MSKAITNWQTKCLECDVIFADANHDATYCSFCGADESALQDYRED